MDVLMWSRRACFAVLVGLSAASLTIGVGAHADAFPSGMGHVAVRTHHRPLPPTNVDIDHTAGNAVVGILWAPSAGATHYHVKRGRHAHGPFALLGSAHHSPFVDHHTLRGRSFYVVTALNRHGESRSSHSVELDRQVP